MCCSTVGEALYGESFVEVTISILIQSPYECDVVLTIFMYRQAGMLLYEKFLSRGAAVTAAGTNMNII